MIEPRTPELAAQSRTTLAGSSESRPVAINPCQAQPRKHTLRWASRSLLAKDQQEQPQALPNADQAKAA